MECATGGSGHGSVAAAAELDDDDAGSVAVGSTPSTPTFGLRLGIRVLAEAEAWTGRRVAPADMLYGLSTSVAAAPSEPNSNKSVSM